jgi:mannosyl-glycoprotein endo-beta-N-acetylglucosaminidase
LKKQNYILIGAIITLLIITKPAVKKIKNVILTISKKDFLNSIKKEVENISVKIGVPYKFMIAQIILETGWGKSSLFSKYNNVGGIKAVKGQKFISLPTIEYIKGVKTTINQNFAVYPDLKSGLIAYSKILQNRYFKKYLNKTKNPVEYAKLLQSGAPKYATDINYVAKIENLVNQINTIV